MSSQVLLDHCHLNSVEPKVSSYSLTLVKFLFATLAEYIHHPFIYASLNGTESSEETFASIASMIPHHAK